MVAHKPCFKTNSEARLVSDHPVRSIKEASRHLLDVASTPPHEEGNGSESRVFCASPSSNGISSEMERTVYVGLHVGTWTSGGIQSWRSVSIHTTSMPQLREP